VAITPSSATLRGKVSQHFTSDASGVWISDVGSLYTNAGLTIPYDGVSSRSDVYLVAQNKTSTGNVSCGAVQAGVSITGVFPAVPHFNHEFNITKRGRVAVKSRSGRVTGRLHGDGTQKVDFNLKFNLRNRLDTLEVKQFVADHDPAIEFYYVDDVMSIDDLYILDGDPPMKVTYAGPNRFSFEVPIFML
jgi:hypothetical protein